MALHVQRDGYHPGETLYQLRDEAPVAEYRLPIGLQSMPAWLVTRHEDVRRVLSDSALFSSTGGAQAASLGEESAARLSMRSPGWFIEEDPPEHTRLRRLLTPEFTVRRIHALVPRIKRYVDDLLDAMESGGGPVDVIETFALPLPSLVICELFGVPYEDRAEFQERSSAQLDFRRGVQERVAISAESRAYMAKLVALQRADPGDDLLGMLVREHGDEITDEELTGIGALLLLAGHETTAAMLGLGTLLLLDHPEQADLVRDRPGAVEQAVEEMLRYLSVVSIPIIRTATEDVTLGGRLIKAGSAVVCSLAIANRDHTLAGKPDVFDITRETVSHIAFGHGIHHCIGAPLARTEMRIAFPALLRRFPGLRLAVPREDVVFRVNSVSHNVQALPVTW
ncbi:cytochrome P450 [Nonomuraea sp. NPDC059023]|uniref:cytochrome P450 n=1 Tax=unclassified Nonomuraea TaxID=2593643 RepID=UPI00367614A1